MVTATEPMIGQIWESRHGIHSGGKKSPGLRVRITNVRPHNVQVLLLGGGGYHNGHGMSKKYYTIERKKFMARYECVDQGKSELRERFPSSKDPIEVPWMVQGDVISGTITVPIEAQEQEQEVTIIAEPVITETNGHSTKVAAMFTEEAIARKNAALASPEVKSVQANNARARMEREMARLSDEQQEEMRQLRWTAHATIPEIARAFHVSTPTAATIVADPNRPRRKPKPADRKNGPVIIVEKPFKERVEYGEEAGQRVCTKCHEAKPIETDYWAGYTRCKACENKRRAETALRKAQQLPSINFPILDNFVPALRVPGWDPEPETDGEGVPYDRTKLQPVFDTGSVDEYQLGEEVTHLAKRGAVQQWVVTRIEMRPVEVEEVITAKSFSDAAKICGIWEQVVSVKLKQ